MARGLETADGLRSSLTRSELRDILIGDGLKEPCPMSKPRKKKRPPKRVVALPGREQSKAAVINTLTSRSGQRSYDRAITDFVDWYCSEPRLAFTRQWFLRSRIFLEQKQYGATTINLRLPAVRRVALEAADSGLLSPEPAAGIRRGKESPDRSSRWKLADS